MSSPAERRIAARHDRVLGAIEIVIAKLAVTKGLSLETALTNAALGNQVHEVFTANGGQGSERTIRNDIRDLLGAPVDRMPDQLRAIPDCPLKVWQRGANTYNLLAVQDEKLRKRLLRRIHALISLFARLTRSSARSSGSSAPPSLPAQCRLTANTVGRKVSRALERALGDAEGQRNNVGHRLAWRCRYLGLDQAEVEREMERYQGRVCALGPDPYTRREAMATVRSVFKHGPRGIVVEGGGTTWDLAGRAEAGLDDSDLFCW